ncbi:hypothetical protein Tco_0888503 [Tanacetum coccineum]
MRSKEREESREKIEGKELVRNVGEEGEREKEGKKRKRQKEMDRQEEQRKKSGIEDRMESLKTAKKKYRKVYDEWRKGANERIAEGENKSKYREIEKGRRKEKDDGK